MIGSAGRSSDELFAGLRRDWNEGQVVEIVAVISLFGFMNRWNDTPAKHLAYRTQGPI